MSNTPVTVGARPGIRRTWVAGVITLGVLTVSVTAGLLSSLDGGAPVIFVERMSSQIGEVASGAAGSLWWVYALLLGGVAAFNPCGIGLVPAYLGLYLNDERQGGTFAARARRALRVSVVVAAAFTVLFGVTGALFSIGLSLVSSFIVGSLPWVGLGVGIVLVVAGGVVLSGRPLRFDAAQRLASRVGRGASQSDTLGYAAFGFAYGLASLGCTLPLFLAVMGTATAAEGRWSSVVAFALYGLGMATTLAVLALVIGVLRVEVVSQLRGATRFLPGLGGALLLASGAYVVYYWLTAGRLLLS